MRIDAFTHLITQRYLDKGLELTGRNFSLDHDPRRAIPALLDVEQRLRDMDACGIDKQVATMPSPPTDQLADDPAICAQLAATINEGMAAVRDRYGERIIPIGTVALNNIPASLAEAERAVKQLGLPGILLYTNSGGHSFDHPALEPFWQLMASLNVPIWIHPTNSTLFSQSKYGIGSTFGWPFNTTVAMTELIFGGVLDRYPNLVFVTHHAGAMVPFFEQRVAGGGGPGAERVAALKRPLLDEYRSFFVDSAVGGSFGAMHASHAFYGAERMLLGSDYPYARGRLKQVVESVEALPVPPALREQIASGNIRKLLKL